MELRKEYPKLSNLMGYLHQDWLHAYYWDNKEPHYAPVIRFFKTHNPPPTVDQAAKQLKEFLQQDFDEKQIEDALFNHFPLGMSISYWKLTHKQWLEEVLKILEEPMEKTKKQFIPEYK